MKWSCFYLHLSRHRVALSDVVVLCNCLCSIGEYRGLVVSVRPAPSYRSLFFFSSGPNCTCVFNSLTPLMSSRLSVHMLAFQLASLTALSFLWFARSVAQRSDFHNLLPSLCYGLLAYSLYLWGLISFLLLLFLTLYCHLEDVGERAVAGDRISQHLWSYRLVCLVRELLLSEVPVLSEGTPSTYAQQISSLIN